MKADEFDWEEIYRDESTANLLGWYFPNLDPDLANALKRLKINDGTFLDLGTGHGHQAIELSKIGFEVTGTDISKTAIDRLNEEESGVNFVQDDILNCTLNTTFDCILDRGCFHVMSPEQQSKYIKTIWDLMAPNGHFFLKCFSKLDSAKDHGPYQFAPMDIYHLFGASFHLLSIDETEYHGNKTTPPKALFAVMTKNVNTTPK